MKQKLSILLIAFLIIPASVMAQYKIENFTDMNQINSLIEEGDYIWVSTSGGVFKRKKSDGSIVTHFNTLNSGISRNRVECMYIDFHGNYWFGTNQGGICKYDGYNWSVYESINGTHIYECHVITEDINGNVWFGINAGKVIRYDGMDNWEVIDLAGEWYISTILSDDNGNVWCGVAGINGACWKIDPEGIVTEIDGPSNKFSDDTQQKGVYDITKDRYGNIWFGYSDGICRLDPSGNWYDYAYMGTGPGYKVRQDSEGNIWWCGWSGVWKYDYSTLSHFTSGKTGDRVDLVLDILYDASNNLWIGGYNGLSKIIEGSSTWSEPWTMNALQSNYVETMAFLDNSTAFLFGQFSYLISYNSETNYFGEKAANPTGCNYSWVKNSVSTGNNEVFMAYLGYGDKILHLMKFDAEGNPECFSTPGSFVVDWPDGFVKDIAYDRDYDLVWIGTEQGLFFKNSNATTLQSWPTQMPDDYINGMDVHNGAIYYATANGIGFYSISDGGKYGSITTADGLPSNTCYDVKFDREGRMYVLSSFNLYRKEADGNFSSFSTGYFTKMDIDSLNNVWLSGSTGAAKFNGSTFKTFNIEEGLNDNNVSNITVSPDNEVWLCSGYFGITRITNTAPKPDFETEITCLPAQTHLVNTSRNVDELTQYEWDINNDGSIDYTGKDFNFQFESKGEYTLKLTAYNDNLKNEVIKEIRVLEAPVVTLEPTGEVTICSGESQRINATIDNYNPELSYTYEWNVGFSGSAIKTDTSGTYSLIVSNGFCETESSTVDVIAAMPYNSATICMVTVDSTTNKNLIVWERTEDAGIESYNIYKLYGNNYVPIGNVPYDAQYSYYTDYLSNPDALAARYAITVVDTCGNESDFSPYHQTIHLGASAGAVTNTYVLDWTPYIDESGVYQPEWYYCWAGSDPSKLELIYSISSSFTEWNDNDPGDRVYYKIEARKPEACFVSLPDGRKAGSGPFIHSLSNLEDNRSVLGIDETGSAGISLYPNPMTEWSKLKLDERVPLPALIQLYDLNGRLVLNERLLSDEYILQKNMLDPGLYMLRIISDRTISIKLVIQ